jgi:hypothetical protein
VTPGGSASSAVGGLNSARRRADQAGVMFVTALVALAVALGAQVLVRQ